MPTLHLRVGGVWTGQTPSPAVPGRTFVQGTTPVGAAPGDIWINPTLPAPAPQYFISGTGTGGAGSWQGNSGAKTFVQDTDPSLVPANGVKNGDIWTRPVSAGNPTAVTSVRTAGAWVVGTPSIPASSRTFIQNTTPIGAASGDLWVDSSTTGKNTVFAFDGTSWINTRAGNKTTIGNTAPATPGVGDSWVDTSVTGTPANKIWDGTNWVIAGGTTAVSTQPAGSFIYQTPTALNGVTLSFGSNYPRQYVRIKGFLRPISEGGDILMYPHFKAPHEWDAADIANESWLAASYGSGGASTSPSRAVNANGATGFKLNAGTDAMWLKANNTVMYSLDFINDGINWNFMWNSTYRCSNDTPIMNMAGASIPVTTDFQEIVFNFVSVHSGGTVVNNTALGKFIVEWQ